VKQNVTETVVNLIAVIVAVTDETPRLLIVNQREASTPGHTALALPNGPFEPASHPSLESSLRRWVEAQTGLDLYYVEGAGSRHRPAWISITSSSCIHLATAFALRCRVARLV
jgi:hypothetical protein